MSIFKKVLSVGSGKLASELNNVVQAINDKEKEFELFSDEEIKVNFQDLSKKLKNKTKLNGDFVFNTKNLFKNYDTNVFEAININDLTFLSL